MSLNNCKKLFFNKRIDKNNENLSIPKIKLINSLEKCLNIKHLEGKNLNPEKTDKILINNLKISLPKLILKKNINFDDIFEKTTTNNNKETVLTNKKHMEIKPSKIKKKQKIIKKTTEKEISIPIENTNSIESPPKLASLIIKQKGLNDNA